MLDLLSPARLRQDGYLEPQPVVRMVEQHLAREADWGAYLWDVLMFQIWLDQDPHRSINSLT